MELDFQSMKSPFSETCFLQELNENSAISQGLCSRHTSAGVEMLWGTSCVAWSNANLECYLLPLPPKLRVFG